MLILGHEEFKCSDNLYQRNSPPPFLPRHVSHLVWIWVFRQDRLQEDWPRLLGQIRSSDSSDYGKIVLNYWGKWYIIWNVTSSYSIKLIRFNTIPCRASCSFLGHCYLTHLLLKKQQHYCHFVLGGGNSDWWGV